MKGLINTMIFGLVLQSFCFAQVQTKRLKVYCITEYIDGYVIRGIDTSKLDTLNIISVKEEVLKSREKFKRLVVGGIYNFEYEDYLSKMAAIPIENFVLRIKTTVVWRGGDSMKDRPVFSKNIRDLFIQEE